VARRADQREQDRRLHDTILSTLTMVALGRAGHVLAGARRAGRPRPAGAAQLAHASRAGSPGRAGPAGPSGRGGRRSCPAAGGHILLFRNETVPATAADRIADCAAEALRNVARHAGTGTAELRVSDGNGQVVVEIIDQGRGFDARSVSRSRRGISESIHGRMAEIGGTAEISAIPGVGTTVTLRWPREGTAGTQQRPGEGTAGAARGPG